MPGGILFSQMQPTPALEGEFNAWYDEEHVPLRLAIDGFEGAVRYRVHAEEPKREEAPRYAVTYWLRDLSVLDTEAYRRIKEGPSGRAQRMLRSVTRFTRFTCLELTSAARPRTPPLEAAPVLYAVWFGVPAHAAADIEAWYREEHIPLLMEEPLWRAAVSYRVVHGEPAHLTHLTLHYLESAEALKSPARQRARGTPWRQRLGREPWFRGLQVLYERIDARRSAGASRSAAAGSRDELSQQEGSDGGGRLR